MTLFSSESLQRARRMSDLAHCNPFLAERIEHERAILGDAFDESTADWNVHPDWQSPLPNITALAAASDALAADARQRLAAGHRPSAAERQLYEDVVLVALYYRHRPALDRLVEGVDEAGPRALEDTWDSFLVMARHAFAGL
jgi:hypothetical protein